MAYQQTTASSVEGLINAIATFSSALGWTVERNSLSGSNRTLTLKRATGDYVHLFNTDTTNLRMRASTGVNTGVAVSAQPGVSVVEAVSNCGAGPFASVFLFGEAGDTPYVHVVFDTGSSLFRHLSFGELKKIGSWTGGTFFDALNINTSSGQNANPTTSNHHVLFSDNDSGNSSKGGVRCDISPSTGIFAAISGSAVSGVPYRAAGGVVSNRDNLGFYLAGVNSWSGVTPLRQIKLRVERGSGFFSEIGYVPGIRMVNIARWAPGDEFSIGPDTWKVFPWWRQGVRPSGDTSSAYSGNYGFAYKKTV